MSLDGVHVDGVLELAVILAEGVGEDRGVLLIGQRCIEREGGKREAGLAGLTDLVLSDLQGGGQLAVRRSTAEVLGQVPGRRAHLKEQFLDRAAYADLPALVPEVALDLAADARGGVGGQAVPDG